MKGLVLNNLYTTGKSIKYSIFVSVIAVIILFLIPNTKLAALLPVGIISINAFEVLKYDAMSGWSKFEITLPVTRNKIIHSKYLTFLLLFIISVLLTFVLFLIFHLLVSPMETNVFFNFLLRGMGLALCMAALTYPATYLLGAEKADSITLYSIGFALAVFFSLSLLLGIIIGAIEGVDEMFSVIFLVISIFFFIISYFVSIMIYKEKEF